MLSLLLYWRITHAWDRIKGSKFSIASLLGVEPGSEKARMFEGGSVAIFRCAPLSCLSL